MTKMLFNQEKARKDVIATGLAVGMSLDRSIDMAIWVDAIPDGTEMCFPDGEDWVRYHGLRVHRDGCVEV